MYNKKDKRRIYWLIDSYLSGKIDEIQFSDDFYSTFDLEVDYDSLTEEENKIFSELSKISARFSPFEEDLKNYPGTYFSKEDLKNKIIETKEKLKHNFWILEDQSVERYPCACCGYLTMSSPEHGTFEICPVCYWEDDYVQFNDINFEGGANGESLKQARLNFKKFGAYSLQFIDKVRPPNQDEIPQSN